MLSSAEKKQGMQYALQEAAKAAECGEVPIGAVIVDPEGTVIGRGYNRREQDQDATQHAEILAIRAANQTLKSWRLEDCSLFVTLEPCCMCAGAIINARIKTVYYGTPDPKAGAAGSVVNLFQLRALNHHPSLVPGLYREQASQLLKTFFQMLRRQQKAVKRGK